MIRKFTLLILLFIGFQSVVKAQTEDSVFISLPFGTDTTCPGDQLTFTAIHTNPTMTVVYQWYHNNVFTGVTLDTFYTTAPVDGDSVYARIFFTNSLGFPDSAQSNTIIVHRSSAIPPRVLASLIIGSNPDCPGHPLTFEAYPINGGPGPIYQWLINGVPQIGSDSLTFTRIFSANDTVSVRMISNSPCRTFDTAYSDGIRVIHDSLTAGITISVTDNPICLGNADTFTAVVTNAGLGWTISWYVDTTFIPGAVGPVYITDSLYNDAHVYAILHAPDPCVINDTTISNVIIMSVLPLTTPMITVTMIQGSNPGCLDSTVTFRATVSGFGTGATSNWYINGVPVATDTNVFRSTFADGDLLTFRMRVTDGNCYSADSITTPDILMERDSTPVAPLVSLIGNLLVANTAGTYIWYFNGSVIPGASGQTFHPNSLGFYQAIRTDGDCPSAPSNTIYISLLDINDVSSSDIKVYPNPTSGMVNIDLAGSTGGVKMDVYSILGQGILHHEITGAHHEADLSHLPAGNYFIVLRDGAGNAATFKVQLAK
ncbi:MAG: T9SS type A sorting domain-containing protein [Bacteroidota bacterium]